MKIYLAAEEKSKIRDYICNKERSIILTKPHYLENYNRTDCNNIFITRARMLEVKGNYRGKQSDLICRWCKNAIDTQQHILKKCPKFQDITINTQYDTYFNDEEESTSTVKDIIQKVKTKLNNPS